MKILLLGKDGQLGWELQRSLALLGELVTLGRAGADGLCGDLSDLDGLRATVDRVQADLIVNAAAYTAVDQAESEPEQAYRINAEAPRVLAQAAARRGALLVHYSTDYIFDGRGDQPWSEADASGPLGVYGASKLAGEQALATSRCRWLVFRTSWVYAAHGRNFVRTVLRLLQQREQLRIVADQIGSPTGAELIADVTAHAVQQIRQQPEKAGLYHLAASGQTSWHGLAQHVWNWLQQHRPDWPVQTRQLEAIPSSDYPTPARRPLNSRLDTSRLQTTFGLHLPPWQPGVDRSLTELLRD